MKKPKNIIQLKSITCKYTGKKLNVYCCDVKDLNEDEKSTYDRVKKKYLSKNCYVDDVCYIIDTMEEVGQNLYVMVADKTSHYVFVYLSCRNII